MHTTIKNVIKNNKKIIENFSFLTFVQIFSLVSPLITYPYILRTVGLELYGIVVYAQSIVGYVSLLINFGFGTSGPRDVAILRDNPQKLSEYVSSVFIIKFFFWIISFVIFFSLIFFIPYFHNYFLVYLFAFFLSLGDLLFPTWFFQGIEKMKYITFGNILIKIVFIFGIFLLVKTKSDYIYIVILNSLGALISGIFGCIMVFKVEKIKFILVPKNIIFRELKTNYTLFISTISIQAYMNLSKLIVGSFLGMRDVALYDLGERIISILKTPIFMFSQAIFPKISREKSIPYINKTMYLVFGITLLGYIVLFYFGDIIIYYFLGEKNLLALNIVRVLGLSLIFISLSIFYGGLRLIPFGYNKEYMVVMVANGLTFIFIITFLWLCNLINIYSVCFAYALVEAFGLVYAFYFNYKLKLLR